MLKRLYDWTLRTAESPRAPWALAAVSFAESSFFPVPPDVMLVPMAMANPKKAWFYATICTIASVLGGLAGYAIGALLFDSLGQWIISLYGHGDKVEDFRRLYQEWGHWIILIKGLTPIPYKIVTIASGLAGYSLFWFTVLSIITRGARFFIVAGLMHRFGQPLKEFTEANFGLVSAVFLVCLIGGFVVVKFLI
jgi:membrane protein YqaA with SNARE-associated domain